MLGLHADLGTSFPQDKTDPMANTTSHRSGVETGGDTIAACFTGILTQVSCAHKMH